MKRFSLELLYHIVGIGSASGLFYKDGTVFIASDNAGYLYEYDTKDQSLSKTKLIDSETLENIPKKQKPDFEAVAEKDGELYLFGSGSTKMRTTGIVINLKTKKIGSENLSKEYSEMMAVSGIDADNFNLEGAFGTNDAWYFLQRGNGSGGNNGIFKLNLDLDHPPKVTFKPMQLPKIKHVTTSFTDAVLVGNDIWFLATAEDTNSTYNDGEILGSIIGKIDFSTMEITYSQQISDKHKFEGLALYSKSEKEISFLLCEDNDTDGMESSIFKLTLTN